MQSKISVWLIGASIGVAVAACSLALFYRSRASELERQYRLAIAQLDRTADATTATAATLASADADGKVSVTPMATDIPSPPVTRPTPAGPGQPSPSGASTNARPSSSRSQRRFSDWVEGMRTNDPQRYAEFQQRRQAFQQEMQSAWTHATNYFLSRDTSRMSDAEQEEYQTMLTLLEQTWTLNQQLQSGLSPEARTQAFATLRSNVTAIIPLLNNERNREYYDAALAMGQSPDDAATMVGYINLISSNTSLRTVLPGVRMGGGMFGDGPPPSRGAPSSAPPAR